MRPKKRYILLHYRGSENLLGLVRARYAERFGAAEMEKASLGVISQKDGFVIMRCRLEHCKRLLEILSSLDGRFVTLNISGTLKSLRSREEEIRKRFLLSGQ